MGEPADRPYGERAAFVKDFAGNHWYLATRLDSARQSAGTVIPFVHLESARAYIDFLMRAFGAVEQGVFEEGGRVVHAQVRIGDAVLEMGEAHAQSLPSTFLLYVDDCDKYYRSALAAGATSISEPADLPYGRSAGVADPSGYRWFPTSPLKPAHSIATVDLSPQPILVMRRQIKPSEIAQALGEMFQHVAVYAHRNGIAIAGAPLARYLECLREQWTIEAGFPVTAVAVPDSESGVFLETLPGGLAATTTHIGPYDKLMETHSAVERWVRAQGFSIRGAVWESYVTDPGQHPDPKDWKTEIFLPLSS